MKQYIALCKRVLSDGTWVKNERTGKWCLTLIDANMEYDVANNHLPVLTTKRMAWKSAIAEMLGYIKGFSSAAQFREIGCNTWNANANENTAWLNNPYRIGKDDMGRCYGVQGRSWLNPEGIKIDQLADVYNDLNQGIDNRSEIITFMNPGERDRACLNSCMHTHTFSLVKNYLYLTSYQRSADLPLGVPFNMIQCAWFLMIMAKITGKVPKKAFHKIVNVHIYEDQIELMEEQILREPGNPPKLLINNHIKTLDDLDTWVKPEDFVLAGYNHQGPINYAFSV